ncbi:MAG: cyanophycinase [Limnohabitans sp.]
MMNIFFKFKSAMILMLLLSGLALGHLAHAGNQSYAYYYLGNPSVKPNIKNPPKNSSVVMMGGGYDVGEAFRWMIRQAGVTPAGAGKTASGGRFVIIRATGSDAYNPYIFSKLGTIDTTTPMGYENVGGIDLGLSTVQTLVVPSRAAANDPFVNEIVASANVIWIAGGDQADYFNFWQGTALDTTLKNAINHHVPVGGTSAGNAILGQYSFVALNGGVTSSQALSDPFNKYMTIDPLNVTSKTFAVTDGLMKIPFLANIITDDHLNTRDRLGRLIAFSTRISAFCGGPVDSGLATGIGVDEETALLLSASPSGGVVSATMAVNPLNGDNFIGGKYTKANSAYFVVPKSKPRVCASGQPLVFDAPNVNVYRMSDPQRIYRSGTPPYSSYISNISTYLGDYTNLILQQYGTDNGLVTNAAWPY